MNMDMPGSDECDEAKSTQRAMERREGWTWHFTVIFGGDSGI